MRKRIVAGNWKMNTTLKEGEILLDELLQHNFSEEIQNKIIIIPPFTHLTLFNDKLKGTSIQLGAQNIYFEKSGAYTGEISASMVKSTGAQYVIIGHSERRQYFNETNQVLAIKINLAIENQLLPIYCCGEILEERDAGIYKEVIKKQINEGLFHLDQSVIKKIIIAYEPVWAIGTGKNASPAQAQEVHSFIRHLLAGKYGSDIANEITILYGGSIKASNAKELFTQPDIDGGLVGGASLDMKEFVKIINSGV